MPLRSPKVVVRASKGRVRVNKVHSIVSNRVKNQEEQFLVRWKTEAEKNKPPLSWHSLSELEQCLEHIQDYLDSRESRLDDPPLNHAPLPSNPFRKRKSPDTLSEIERRPSPVDRRRLYDTSRTPSASRSSSVSSSGARSTSGFLSRPSSIDIYNGVLDYEDGFVFARSASGPEVQNIDIRNVPTTEMMEVAQRSDVSGAATKIREAYVQRLTMVPGKPLWLINNHDQSTPSLRFQFITDYILREGVHRVDPAAQVGCKRCSPHMGQDIGCEYTKRCDCLEYAAVDEAHLNDAQMKAYQIALQTGGSTMGFSKRFPYFATGGNTNRVGCLVPFYLNSRRPIYECNDNCNCGPYCRNKNVQFGRTVELEIFKTASGRGWGLKCRTKLYQGQFIDTYRGEIITDAEATRREQSSSKAKASYLYELDKFAESEGLEPEDIYVVDGEFMGGPTKFINHSCEPNCRQYTVSYNKHDCKVYDIALFACRDIPAGEELTFDYLDKEEDDEIEEPGEGAIPCLCGAAKCRKWLWT